MTQRRTRTIVPYTAEEMLDLVADVERYPAFLPWCAALRVLSRETTPTGETVTAEMVVAYKVFRERFKSRARVDRAARRIDVDYLDGPFRSLRNVWRFEPSPEGGSAVDFEIEFEFRSRLLQATAQAVFDKAFLKMSEAFVDRAHDVYGAD